MFCLPREFATSSPRLHYVIYLFFVILRALAANREKLWFCPPGDSLTPLVMGIIDLTGLDISVNGGDGAAH